MDGSGGIYLPEGYSVVQSAPWAAALQRGDLVVQINALDVREGLATPGHWYRALFGQPMTGATYTVIRDGQPVASSDWQAAIAKELFFYVLLYGPLERDSIGAVFWPELPAKNVTGSFHNALYRVRGALGAGAIVVEEGRYQVGDIDYWFDVIEFESLVERARLLPVRDLLTRDLWQRAVALYRGDFLPEVERVWSVPKREELRQMLVEALVGVGRSFEARKDYDSAVEWYRKALDADALREDVHRRIMTSFAEAERRSDAVAQYLRCRELLRSELHIEPSAETRELYERIAGSEGA